MTVYHSVNWEAMDWTEIRPGVERKGFTGQGATMALHRLSPGHETKPHSHPHEQLVYIVSGMVDFHLGDDVVRLDAGGLLVVPPHVVHYAEVVGSEYAFNLDVFTPARPEYA